MSFSKYSSPECTIRLFQRLLHWAKHAAGTKLKQNQFELKSCSTVSPNGKVAGNNYVRLRGAYFGGDIVHLNE